MRILKKLSLRRGLDRMTQPNFSEPRLNRLTPQQELHKYAVKPAFFQFKWAMALLFGGLSAVYFKLYLDQLYKKQSVGQQSLEQFAEGLVRYGQYKNYMEKKDRKFDFLDIGVMEKYPYVKKSQQQPMM